jgi:hypothetical protein
VILTGSDLVIYEVDARALSLAVARALAINPSPSLAGPAPGCWAVGTYRGEAGRALPSYLAIQASAEGFTTAVAELLLSVSEPFLLLAPTARRLEVGTFERLRSRQCPFIALSTMLLVDEAGSLTATTTLGAVLARERVGPGASENVFKKVGALWTVCFRGELAHFGDLEGFRYLLVLLRNPGRKFKYRELANEAGKLPAPAPAHGSRSRSARALADEGLVKTRGGYIDAVPDEQAKLDYGNRIVEIRAELQQARENNDLGTIERLTEEQERILEELSEQEKSNGSSKQLRQDVRGNLKYSLEQIRQELSPLWEHLNEALDQGPQWRYREDLAVAWEF